MPLALAFPNRFNNASLSGIGWTVGLPLSYLATRQLSQVARALATSGSFYAAFSAATEAGSVALCGHNLTTDGQWRLRGFSVDPRPTVQLDFTLGTLPDGLTCSRSSGATYFDSSGVLQTAANNVGRITHDMETHACLGLLTEASAINELTYARDGTNAAWTKTTMSTGLTATGIDGVSNTATALAATSANARISHTHTTGAPFVFSVYLKRVTGSGVVRISADNFATNTTCALTTSWQRFEISSSASSVVGIQIDTSGDAIQMDYAQCELGTIASSPILTTSAVATRQGDAISYVPSGLPLAAGAFAVAGRLLRRPSADASLSSVSDGTGTASVYVTSAGVPTAQYVNSGTQCSITVAAVASGATFGMAFTYAVNDYRFANNGTQGTADTSGTVRTGNATSITLGNSSNRVGYLITKFAAYASAKANADLNNLASYTDSEHAADYDSGLTDAWPADWVAATTAEERDGVRGTAVIHPGQACQYWRVDLTDSTNPDGYVQLGRVFIGTRWQPAHGMLTGATIGYESRSTTTEAEDGAEYHDERRSPLVVRFNLEAQTQEEAMRKILEMQRQLGTTGELLFIWDTGDTLYQPSRTFLGRLRSLSPLTAINSNLWSATFEVKESL